MCKGGSVFHTKKRKKRYGIVRGQVSEKELRRMEVAKQTGRYFTYRRRMLCAVDFYVYLHLSITRAIGRGGP
jgi:hypothetical protein